MDDETWTEDGGDVAGPVPASVWVAAVGVPAVVAAAALGFGAAAVIVAAVAVMVAAAFCFSPRQHS